MLLLDKKLFVFPQTGADVSKTTDLLSVFFIALA